MCIRHTHFTLHLPETFSCTSPHFTMTMTRGIIWEEGNRHGKLEVVSYAESTSNGVRWMCRCDCGRSHIVFGRDLRAGRVKSCGKCDRGEEAFWDALSKIQSPCDKGCQAWESCKEEELACQPFANFVKFGWDTAGCPDKFPPTRAQYRKLFRDKQPNKRKGR